MAGTAELFAGIVGRANVLAGGEIRPEHAHDETLGAEPVVPLAVVLPGSTSEVAEILRAADRRRIPVTARGSATGLSGGAIPQPDGIVVSFDRMNRIVEIDVDNHVAVVQAGATLDDLDKATAGHGLVYPVFPGENSASLGGNVATNAGGMRAVKYGVTRHHVLGVEAVLANGEVLRTGGRFVKSSSGYDLTQLVVGSEGTLALVTEAILKLHPRANHAATVLAPFAALREVAECVPRVVGSGIGPVILEYVDSVTMAALTAHVGLDLGVPEEVRSAALAYLVVVLEGNDAERLDADVVALGGLLAGLGAIDVYVLPPLAGSQLIDAREKAFWVAKAAGADDLIDMVVPRAAIPRYLEEVAALGKDAGSLVLGCGHVGDGNIHLSVFQPDRDVRHALMAGIYRAGIALGGAISGEHGIGSSKRTFFLDLEDPAKLALMRRIKAAFDPNGILNPGKVLG